MLKMKFIYIYKSVILVILIVSMLLLVTKAMEGNKEVVNLVETEYLESYQISEIDLEKDPLLNECIEILEKYEKEKMTFLKTNHIL